MIRSYNVKNMTCQSCVKRVTRAVQEVPGVQGVEVSLATGTVRIEAAPEVTSDRLVAAISSAGYPNVAPLAEEGTRPAEQRLEGCGATHVTVDQQVGGYCGL